MNITESAAIVSHAIRYYFIDAIQGLLINPIIYTGKIVLEDLTSLIEALSFVALITILVSLARGIQRRYSLYHEADRVKISDEKVDNLSGSDIQSIYKRISWSYTQPDIESVEWLNQSAQTLWPSIKTMLYKFILCDLVRKAQDRLKKREIAVENIRLGDAIPVITGIQYIEEDDALTILDDAAYINRFMIEVEYRSDRRFQILMGSLPLFGRINLSRLCFQVRFLITLTHTTKKLRARDLDLLDTPGDFLLPAINSAQVALVDLPSIDWTLERPSNPDNIKSKMQNKPTTYRMRYFDPLNLINHPYFKFLMHSLTYLSLKIVQPIDIKVGQYLHISSIC